MDSRRFLFLIFSVDSSFNFKVLVALSVPNNVHKIKMGGVIHSLSDFVNMVMMEPMHSLSEFDFLSIIILDFENNSQAPETTWAPGARCVRCGTNGQALVRSLRNFHERFRRYLKPQINIFLRQKLF